MGGRSDGATSWRWLVAAVVVGFFTNLVWENAHGGLYGHVIPGLRYLRAAAGDVALLGIGLVAAWPLRRRAAAVRASVVAVTLLVAIVVERAALAEGRWVYTDAMPTVGGVGVSPLLQLPVTGLIAVSSARWWSRRTHPAGARSTRDDQRPETR